MTEELKRYESSIDKQYSFRWTPEYEEEFRTNLNETVFSPITKEVIEQLGWELIYEAPSLIEARKNASGFNWGQNLTISYQSGKIKIKSQSIQSPFFDFGRNSKRVKLFIYAFKALEKTMIKKRSLNWKRRKIIYYQRDSLLVTESEEFVMPNQLVKINDSL